MILAAIAVEGESKSDWLRSVMLQLILNSHLVPPASSDMLVYGMVRELRTPVPSVLGSSRSDSWLKSCHLVRTSCANP